MRIYGFSTIGMFHHEHNEDFLVIEDAGEGRRLIAVMDGCSMGRESHFAAALTGKILRRIAKGIHYKEFATRQRESLGGILQGVLRELFSDLKSLKNQLDLDRDELLCTLILGIVDDAGQSAEIIVVGDGVVHVDGITHDFDQDNRPDYLGYHLHKDFEGWFAEQTQRLSIRQTRGISICSDGIFSFDHFDNKHYANINNGEIIHFLLNNKDGMGKPDMLRRKILTIEQEWGLRPNDDLSIVKVVFD